MRIAYANAGYHPGDTRGRNAHIHQFINRADAQGHEIWVWPARDIHSKAHMLPRGRVARWAALRRMDALYVRLQNHPVDSLRYGLFPFRQIAGFPLVAWELNSLPGYDPVNPHSGGVDPVETLEFRRLARGCDLAVCVSETLAAYARDELKIENTLVAPNGSDPELFRPGIQPVNGLERDPATVRVVWIGSADLRWHDLRLLEETAARLTQDNREPRIEFHLIGPIPQDLSENSARFGLILHGPQPYESLPGWLAGMDIGLVLSQPGPYDYNSPLKLFDYLASGLVAVGTEHPQLREVFARLNQTDLIVPPGDPQALSETLASLFAQPERRQSLAKAGRQLIVDTYNWDRTVRDTFSVLTEMRRSRPPSKNYLFRRSF